MGLLLCALAPGARGQEAAGASREVQAALYDQLRARPDDLDLMFRYAQVSIALKDYEAAISTMERMLIYRQDLPRVRLELGVAYFALGSYEAATVYFDQVLAEPGTPAPVRARVEAFKAQIAGRSQRNTLRGLASVGLTWASNANLGPDDAAISLFGADATLDEAAISQDDVGARVSVGLSHSYDLQRATNDAWVSDFSFFGLRYGTQDSGNLAFLRARSGPRMALDADEYGPKIRPYVEVNALYSNDDPLYAQYGFGAEYSNTLDDAWSIYADTSFGYRNFFEPQDDEDAYIIRGLAGAAYSAGPGLLFRGTATTQVENAQADFNTNIELGGRLGAEWAYDSGMDWAGSAWVLSGYLDGRVRLFDAPEAVIDPNTTRRDLDLRAGVSHLVALQDGLGVQLEVEGLWRNSTIANFDLTNVGVTLSLQYKF